MARPPVHGPRRPGYPGKASDASPNTIAAVPALSAGILHPARLERGEQTSQNDRDGQKAAIVDKRCTWCGGPVRARACAPWPSA